MRLIDADELIRQFKKRGIELSYEKWEAILDCIYNSEPVDLARDVTISTKPLSEGTLTGKVRVSQDDLRKIFGD